MTKNQEHAITQSRSHKTSQCDQMIRIYLESSKNERLRSLTSAKPYIYIKLFLTKYFGAIFHKMKSFSTYVLNTTDFNLGPKVLIIPLSSHTRPWTTIPWKLRYPYFRDRFQSLKLNNVEKTFARMFGDLLSRFKRKNLGKQ